MRRYLIRNFIIGSSGLAIAASSTATVFAQNAPAAPTTSQVYQANLTPLNNSGASGTSTVKISGTQATVNINVTGASPGLAHAQHIHMGGAGNCPATPTGTNKDGEPNTVSTTEAQPSTGPMKIALTTTGSTGTESTLSLDRMPTADASGNIAYTRTFSLPSNISATDMSTAVIETHGISQLTGDKTKYDGTKKSEINAQLSAEATIPSTCGKLVAAPAGGAATGGGSMAGPQNGSSIAIGALSLIAAGSLTLWHIRRDFSFAKR